MTAGWIQWGNKIHWTNDGKVSLCGYKVGANPRYRPAPRHEYDNGYRSRYCGICARIWENNQ